MLKNIDNNFFKNYAYNTPYLSASVITFLQQEASQFVYTYFRVKIAKI